MTPSSTSDRLLLAHIRECIDRIQEYTQGERATFLASRMVQDAVVRNLQNLAESTQRLSGSLKAMEPGIPWRDIAGFRNVLTHGYLGLDLDLVWTVVEQDLPSLDQAVDRLRARLDGAA